MDLRGFLENKYGAAAGFLILLLAVGFVGINFFQGTVVGDGHRGITLANCNIDSNNNINDRCNLEYNDPDFGNMRGDGWDIYVHEDGNTDFRVEVDYLRYFGEDFAPQLPYLARNGYLAESGREQVQEDGDIGNIRMSDIQWNSQVRSSLESGTQCSVEIKPYSISEIQYTWNDSGEIKTQKYHEEWYREEPDYENIDNLFDERVTLASGQVDFSEHSMWCQFDFEEMMEKMTGKDMVEFKAGRLEAGGDDYDEGYAKINVNFGIDSDQDGIRDEIDACPEEPGIPEKDGCPNEPSMVESVDGPGNVTVNESASYSVQVSNPDGDETSVFWSNGDTGESTEYSWSSPGSKTVSVTVDDGFDERTESVQVDVIQPPEPPSPLEALSNFFSNLWDIITFSD